MTFNIKIIQLSLVSIGVILILITYFLYPQIKKEEKISVVESDILIEENEVVLDGKKGSLFENVEYKGFYNIDNSFSVKSENAHIFDEEPDLVYMKEMHVTLYMNDGRIIVITSDEGVYNKVSYNCFFKNNVKATDGETELLSDNLDLLANEDYASVYNNVVLSSNKGTMVADKVDYNFETELYDITMFDDKPVKIKLIK